MQKIRKYSETGHIKTICQAKLNISGTTFTGTQKMNIFFSLQLFMAHYNTVMISKKGGEILWNCYFTVFKTFVKSFDKPTQNSITYTTHTLPLWSKIFKQNSPTLCHYFRGAKPQKNYIAYLKQLSIKAFHKTRMSSVFCKSCSLRKVCSHISAVRSSARRISILQWAPARWRSTYK